MTDELVYIRTVLAILADAELMGQDTPVPWRVGPDSVRFSVMCSDMFAWACADAETIEPGADIDLLMDRLNDLRALEDDYEEVWLGELFCCRKRGMRPMNAWFKLRAKSNDLGEGAWALFEAAGPERESTWHAP